MTILPLAPDVAPVYGRIRAELDRKGTPIGPLDLIIAAQALALKATLVSNNLKEFRRIEGFRCEDWTVSPGRRRILRGRADGSPSG